jgi:hypothetical protein
MFQIVYLTNNVTTKTQITNDFLIAYRAAKPINNDGWHLMMYNYAHTLMQNLKANEYLKVAWEDAPDANGKIHAVLIVKVNDSDIYTINQNL